MHLHQNMEPKKLGSDKTCDFILIFQYEQNNKLEKQLILHVKTNKYASRVF